MSEKSYLDFDLLIEREKEGFSVRVTQSPAGQAEAEFTLPFSDLELENFTLRLGRSRGSARRVESSEMQAAKSFGGTLFGAVFSGEVRSCLRASSDEASRQGVGLRVRLHLAGAPELGGLPWEYLYDPALNRFLALSTETPIIRYLDLPERVRPLEVKPPLRLLAMVASPGDLPRLEVEREYENLSKALDELTEKGSIALERLAEPTLAGLQRQLRQAEYHIFHFIGHGGFDRKAEDGVLYFESEDGRTRQVGSQYLGTLLHDHRSLRLAVLNACEGGRGASCDPFSGTAQGLVQQGVPAVIAMQSEISDEAAITFSQDFYSAVAAGYPVDAALAEARKAIFAQVNELEWGTPVLYMRAPDGKIFDLHELSEDDRRQIKSEVLQQRLRYVHEQQEAAARKAQSLSEERLTALLPPSPSPPPLPPAGPGIQSGPSPISPGSQPLKPKGATSYSAGRLVGLVLLAFLLLVVWVVLLSNNSEESPSAPQSSSDSGADEPASSAPESGSKESLATALNRAQMIQLEAFQTLDTSKLSGVLTGQELTDVQAAAESLAKQGVYAVAMPAGEEIQSYSLSADGAQAEVEVLEKSSGMRFLNRETNECVGQILPFEGTSTVFLERGPEGWLISSTQSHYAIPQPVSCEEEQ